MQDPHKQLPSPTFHQRRLPHITPAGETLFLTFRLAGSLPRTVVRQLREEREAAEAALRQTGLPAEEVQAARYRLQRAYFGKFDALLDSATFGPEWLRYPRIADLVAGEILMQEEQGFQVLAYCLMPNHIHIVQQLPEDSGISFSKALQLLKGRTARQANALLKRTGEEFWQAETYDHVVRNAAELQRIVAYVLNNPVKAGLVKDWTEWPHTYLM
jgi:REP element-mobilizing transposase RayT